MTKKFQLDSDVKQALKDLADFNRGRAAPADFRHKTAPQSASVPHETAPLPAAPAFPAPADRLLDWYRAMKPRTMPRFVWMIMLAAEAAGHKGRIEFDACAERLMTTREKVGKALNDLVRDGFFSVVSTEKDAKRRIVCKTVELKK